MDSGTLLNSFMLRLKVHSIAIKNSLGDIDSLQNFSTEPLSVCHKICLPGALWQVRYFMQHTAVEKISKYDASKHLSCLKLFFFRK